MPKKAFLPSIFFSFWLILPVYLTFIAKYILPAHFFIYLFVSLVIGTIFYRRYLAGKNLLIYKKVQLEEKINLSRIEEASQIQANLALHSLGRRYDNLRHIIEEVNQHLDEDMVGESLCRIAFEQVAGKKGNCLLYLVDSFSHEARLFKSKKEDESLMIKAKKGDIFDYWVLRHAVALLVEDSRRDFRFDPEKNRSFDPRPILSIASCPLLVGNNLLGLLRLDSDEANVFSQEDLRLLCAISDLGGAAIENARLFQNMRELAIHDPLTSLFTKRHFLECLRQEISRSSLNQNNFSLLMLDIDFFKKYNDEFGHTAGDIVLNKISRLMRQELEGKKPVISRFGGEEFCLLLPGQRRKEAIEVAESLRQRIGKEKMILRRRETQVTVSIGIAEYPRDSLVDTELIQKADKMMYLAKQKGRNRVCAA